MKVVLGKKAGVLFGSLLLLSPFFLPAQTPGYYFHHLETTDGLSQATNAYVFKDSRGFVWVSSLDGLNRYDGLEVKVYRHNYRNHKSIAVQNINSPFFEDHRGDLCFTSSNAINRYNQ